MRTQILASSLLVAGALAGNPCMTDAEATTVANNFKALIDQPFSLALAESALTTDYTDYASGVATLIASGCPNGPIPITGATFSPRDEFIAAQSAQPPITFDILNQWNNCDTVMIRWRTNDAGPVEPTEDVTGLIVLETVYNASQATTQPWQIENSYSEFNSGAWLYDLGVFVPNCTTAAKKH